MISYVSTQENSLVTKMLYKERKNMDYLVNQSVAFYTSSGTKIKPSGKSMHRYTLQYKWCKSLMTCLIHISSIDATKSNRIGRFVNHSKHSYNALSKVVTVNSEPHLCLIAARSIAIGEEILYDYADNRQEVVKANPWLKHWQNIHTNILTKCSCCNISRSIPIP